MDDMSFTWKLRWYQQPVSVWDPGTNRHLELPFISVSSQLFQHPAPFHQRHCDFNWQGNLAILALNTVQSTDYRVVSMHIAPHPCEIFYPWPHWGDLVVSVSLLCRPRAQSKAELSSHMIRGWDHLGIRSTFQLEQEEQYFSKWKLFFDLLKSFDLWIAVLHLMTYNELQMYNSMLA